MKRIFWLCLTGLLAVAASASAQLMGSGRFWISGDGGIPKFTATIDGDLSDLESNGYHLFWKPSDINAWGDKFGFSKDSDLESRRIRIFAIDVDNNLYLADGEDPSENGTDADWQGNYFLTWDENNLYMAADNVDNVYDVVQGPDDPVWAFWKRDMAFLAFDMLNIGGAEAERSSLPLVFVHPLNLDEAVFSLQFQSTSEVGADPLQVMYGNDPDFFLGAQLMGGPSAQGYWFEVSIPWDLLFLFEQDARSSVGEGYQFRLRYIVADPDGDDQYGQTYWGGDQTNLGNVSWWPQWFLTNEMTATAVEATTWGTIKELYR